MAVAAIERYISAPISDRLVEAPCRGLLSGKGLLVNPADVGIAKATVKGDRRLDVTHIDIAKDGTVIQSRFDPLMEAIIGDESDFVIDNGAATFLPLTKYLVDNDIYQILEAAGKKVFIHSVLTGGQAKSDTYNGFCELISKTNGNAKIVVWENEFWGPVEYDGHSIAATKLFKDADRAGRIAGRVKIADRSSNDAFVEAVAAMTSAHLTIDDVKASSEFGFLVKNRLSKVVGDIFSELNKVNWQ